MFRNVSVILPGSGEPRQFVVEPGVTAGDLLGQLGLEDYVLMLGNGEPPLPRDYNVSGLPANATLYATTAPEAGRK